MNEQQHWDHVYRTKASDAVSWYRQHLETSLALIARATTDRSAQIIDVGGGEATLVDDLLAEGYRHVSVLDISQAAVEVAKKRLGPKSDQVNWLVADITKATLPNACFDVWHDRAVFHFLTEEAQRIAYVKRVAQAVKPGGHVIIATFGLDGPEQCSGLDVVRYDSSGLHDQFGTRFKLVESSTEFHETPFGTTQQFLYCYCILD
ncbi:class I SAM-dependent methyltransferase [Duganella vulcania]|uniref:Methyltransferase domain-containing protein n=1 Tax=Duganella vulcania TaxID=2692166 RepID=A0A845GT84_9BURK|nr:class I SAM-dependent methyltransferase [Duganella vulcania]MYM95887.1 methyltransferase domain-containing protein [Duganella vulcania]